MPARESPWLHSYVSTDLRTTFCVYDGPDPEAIRAVAARNGLPVDSVTQIRILDPYFYATELALKVAS
jgi:hypothetical protein